MRVDVVFLDFVKAFYKVPRTRMVAKLEAHAIRGEALRWIHNWRSGRKQRVVLNGKMWCHRGVCWGQSSSWSTSMTWMGQPGW